MTGTRNTTTILQSFTLDGSNKVVEGELELTLEGNNAVGEVEVELELTFEVGLIDDRRIIACFELIGFGNKMLSKEDCWMDESKPNNEFVDFSIGEDSVKSHC